MSNRLNTYNKTNLTVEPFQFEELVQDLVLDLDAGLEVDTHLVEIKDGIHRSSLRYKTSTGTVQVGIAIDESDVDEAGYAEIRIDGSDFDDTEGELYSDLLSTIEDVLSTLA